MEQIVASHPEMHGAGELPCMGRILSQVSMEIGTPADYPDCMAALDEASADALGQSYVDCLESYAPEASGAVRISDKLPGNFLNLGLIALILPRARIIYCRRNPLDNCLSCYFQFFTSNLTYSLSLSSVGHYYREHERLMRHWETVLPSSILTVDYKALVAEQEAESRKIIEFAGLEWDDACLFIKPNARSAPRASGRRANPSLQHQWNAGVNTNAT
ncbi:MAG: sulfotransferase [Proteobacteria bacterium]|nr:sulfotransferase [Pseudomonadota bacterium]